jgi:hypothetical protein
VIVAYPLYTKQKPPIVSIVAAQACFNLTGLARLTRGWIEAITPRKIGPTVGSCGSAAFNVQPRAGTWSTAHQSVECLRDAANTLK